MKTFAMIRALMSAAVVLMFGWLGTVRAADLNPAAITITPPKDIKWVEGANGAAQAVLAGDPNKAGLYVVLTKWHPNHMSRPHFHPNDRFITVISGTWWVGTGEKYAPETTVPVRAGSTVTHFGKQIHYDGAKDEEVVLEIVGMGPATSTPAEVK
ncbi:MAG: cupin domain-containing protein [Bryobacteraceae bacterium]